MMSRYAKCAVTVLLVLGSAPALAQQGMNQNTALFPSGGILEGTPQEQAACAADAHRYCRDEIPNTFMVLACLKNEREKISKSCQQVLNSHGQ
jgi:hypothetical protein